MAKRPFLFNASLMDQAGFTDSCVIRPKATTLLSCLSTKSLDLPTLLIVNKAPCSYSASQQSYYSAASHHLVVVSHQAYNLININSHLKALHSS